MIYSPKIKNPEMISRAQPAPNNIKSKFIQKKEYKTPNETIFNKSGEKIMVTFIKDDNKYNFYFYPKDSISNQID